MYIRKILIGILILGIYWWINKYVLTDKRFYDPGEQKTAKKNSKHLEYYGKIQQVTTLTYLLQMIYQTKQKTYILGCIPKNAMLIEIIRDSLLNRSLKTP